jgi:hypothetical protein
MVHRPGHQSRSSQNKVGEEEEAEKRALTGETLTGTIILLPATHVLPSHHSINDIYISPVKNQT